MTTGFADRLALVLKARAISRGQLAAELQIDKSLVSRWLSGGTVPGNHNLSRLTAFVAAQVPGFTMFDWESDTARLASRLGIDDAVSSGPLSAPIHTLPSVPPFANVPDFGILPAFAAATHDTATRGSRYCGLWRSWMPTFGRPNDFHCEHTVIQKDGDWLTGYALGFSYRWPLVAMIANGQLFMHLSDSINFVTRQFSRADEPIIDQIDGLMMSPASLPHQAPTACRIIMQPITPPEATIVEVDAAIIDHAADRRLVPGAELDETMRSDLLPDCGPSAQSAGGDRLLRSDTAQRLVRTRYF
ncbi:helix-turn-helix domain-containing protein [Glacieibacterium frigidum]|uniref:Helix-turn-helix transcriptional regulator n=1 Tax=Glacieibacterium frigidum TaxID=2593303 RepID=A0A552U8A8_9SPHN|nr:helix-turn-helix transcriptional regulator [Glacieibacterium frigidum]TRW14419.1 helix-turn-helix transcriptional regulator [Glacieibacterium frigidum]